MTLHEHNLYYIPFEVHHILVGYVVYLNITVLYCMIHFFGKIYCMLYMFLYTVCMLLPAVGNNLDDYNQGIYCF